jgi:hypothetical protein
MIERPQVGGFIDETRAARTPYGWLLQLLEESGSSFGKFYIGQVLAGPSTHAYTYRAFVAEKGDARWVEVARDPLMRLAFAAPMAIAFPNDYQNYIDNHFFKLPHGAEPQQTTKDQFKTSWNTVGIRPTGEKLKGPDGGPIDKESILTVTDTAVEVRVPIEIPVFTGSGEIKHAHGHVVVECKDPAVLEMLKRYKASADPAKGTHELPPEMRAELLEKFKDPGNPTQAAFQFRIARIESDMVPVVIQDPRGGKQ